MPARRMEGSARWGGDRSRTSAGRKTGTAAVMGQAKSIPYRPGLGGGLADEGGHWAYFSSLPNMLWGMAKTTRVTMAAARTHQPA